MLSDKKNRAIYDQYGAEGLREGVGLGTCAVFSQLHHALRQTTVPVDFLHGFWCQLTVSKSTPSGNMARTWVVSPFPIESNLNLECLVSQTVVFEKGVRK